MTESSAVICLMDEISGYATDDLQNDYALALLPPGMLGDLERATELVLMDRGEKIPTWARWEHDPFSPFKKKLVFGFDIPFNTGDK